MLEFKKYNSIENNVNTEFMEKILAEMPSDLKFVVQEKVHGTNTSFLCDGVTLSFAKRTAVLGENEKFYNYPELLAAYSDRVFKLYAAIKRKYEAVSSVVIYGEMFGGFYPHEDVKNEKDLVLIQKGVYYSPAHEFYGFDIYIFTASEGRYLPVNEVNELFDKCGFFYAKTLYEGNLAECLQYPNKFISKIPEWLGLPPLDDNICEGVVIRPLEPQFLRNGKRVIVKNKNARFAEVKPPRKHKVSNFKQAIFSEELNSLFDIVERYVNNNRLNNVLSHEEEAIDKTNLGKVIGFFTKDIYVDFIKDNGEAFNSLKAEEKKIFSKKINLMAVNLIKRTVLGTLPEAREEE